METRTRSLIKAISWRVIGALTTFVITMAVTGSVPFALSISVIETISKIGLYYLHERAWARVRFKRPVPEEA